MAIVSFVGLGVMGGPMAGHLVAKGHQVTVWNRTPAKSEPLRAAGAKVAGSLAEVAQGAEVVFTCVSRTEDLEECLASIAPTAARGTLFVDHSTVAVDCPARVSARLGGFGLRFVDAPITGGSVGAQRGQLTIFCGGSPLDFAEVEPILAAYAKRAELVGPTGSGQMMKMANQIAVAGALLALCESFAFAKKAGLDLAQTRALLGSGAAGSWAMEFYGQKILDSDWTPGFSVVNQRKDLGYAERAARDIGAMIPTSALADRLLALLDLAGRGEDTTAALYEVFLQESAE